MIRQRMLAIVVILIIASIGVSVVYIYWPSSPVKNSVVFAIEHDSAHLDPHLVCSSTIVGHLFESLVHPELKGKEIVFEPWLAESWRVYNETHMIFNLRKGVKFHSGKELTAHDVVGTYSRLMLDPDFPATARWVLASLDGFEALDNYTVIIGSSQGPVGCIFACIGQFGRSGIINAELAKELGTDYGTVADGTGPYKLEEWIPGEKLVVTRHENYWGTPPKIDKITWIEVRDEMSRIAALESGDVDIIWGVPPFEVQRLEDEGLIVDSREGTRAVEIMLNTLSTPFSDVRVRQACNYAVDIDSICENVFFGSAKRAVAPISEANFGFSEHPIYYYDPEKAKQLLTDAGYPDGFDIMFWSPEKRYMMDRIVVEAVVGYLDAVGIRATLEFYEWSTFRARVEDEAKAVWMGEKTSPDYDMILYSMSTIDADFSEYMLYYTGDYGGALTSRNYHFYSNPLVDELLYLGRSTMDQDKRRQYYAEVHALIMNDAPSIFLYSQPQITAYSPKLKGVLILPDDNILFEGAYFEG